MSGARQLLIVDDDLWSLRAVAPAMRRLGWDVRTSTEPIDPEPGEAVLTDWHPHGPEMLRRAPNAVVYTASPGSVPAGHRVVNKCDGSSYLDAALRGAS